MSEKIVFELDDEATTQLIKLMDQCNFESMGETLSYCLRLATDIQIQTRKGFVEIIVQNPETGAQRKLILPPK